MKHIHYYTFAAALFLSTSAHAGFQFTGPVNPQPQGQVGELLPVPQDPVQMPAVPAQIVVETPTPAPVVTAAPAPTPVIAPAPVQEQQPTQVMTAPAPTRIQAPVAQAQMQTQPITTMPVTSSDDIRWNPQPIAMRVPVNNDLPVRRQSGFDMAVGFGDNLPLVTALEQVIPGNYTYSIAPELERGQTVSWQGGQPWPDVLDNMLASLDYQSRIEGNNVRINAMTPTPSAIAPAPQPLQPRAQEVAYQQPQAITAAPAPQAPAVIAQAPTAMIAPQQTYAPALQKDPVPLIAAKTTENNPDEKDSIVPETTAGQWTALSGTSLRTVLESWSSLEGVDLFWSSDYDYPLVGDVNVSGTYEEAVEILLSGFSDAKPKPVGRLHPNLPHGPAVLLIETLQTSE